MGAEAAKGMVDADEDEGEDAAEGRRLYFDFLLLEPPVPLPPPREVSPPPKPPKEEVALDVAAVEPPPPPPIPPMGPGEGKGGELAILPPPLLSLDCEGPPRNWNKVGAEGGGDAEADADEGAVPPSLSLPSSWEDEAAWPPPSSSGPDPTGLDVV